MNDSQKLPVVGLEAALNAASYLTSFLHYSDFTAFPKEAHEALQKSLASLFGEISQYESFHNSKE